MATNDSLPARNPTFDTDDIDAITAWIPTLFASFGNTPMTASEIASWLPGFDACEMGDILSLMVEDGDVGCDDTEGRYWMFVA